MHSTPLAGRSHDLCLAGDPGYPTRAHQVRRGTGKTLGEVGVTWLIDAKRMAAFMSIVACEMPVGRLLEIDIGKGSAGERAIALLSHMGARCGYPERILLDASAQFHAPQIETWCDNEGISVVYLARIGISAITKFLFDRLCSDIGALGRDPALADCQKVAGKLLRENFMACTCSAFGPKPEMRSPTPKTQPDLKRSEVSRSIRRPLRAQPLDLRLRPCREAVRWESELETQPHFLKPKEQKLSTNRRKRGDYHD